MASGEKHFIYLIEQCICRRNPCSDKSAEELMGILFDSENYLSINTFPTNIRKEFNPSTTSDYVILDRSDPIDHLCILFPNPSGPRNSCSQSGI